MNSINNFFLRISSSCNLNCDYCYVFKHRDKTFLDMPPVMKEETIKKFCSRLIEYSEETNTTIFNIIFHGGEPLLCGEQLFNFIDIINSSTQFLNINFSLQTNGTLLNSDLIRRFNTYNVGISLSLDGPLLLHDKHRKFKTGQGSFKQVLDAVQLLKQYPNIFEGIISVIDPTFNPKEILQFFSDLGIQNIDMLLPDATYQDPPIAKAQCPDIYINWLINAFDVWFDEFQDIKFRTFESILESLCGINSATDAFGFGSLDYLTIETDGSYHTSDILKSTYNNASSTGLTLTTASFREVLNSEAFINYNKLISPQSLSAKCQHCIIKNICGGGSLPHRYNIDNGFNNPSIYCNELFTLITHAYDKLLKIL